ncbi:peptidase S8 and S53, subtilisin, kexin, sedolisin [Rubrobacter xylanophilus DSM 9941]|uniref:Peptidase S8 and S53, subtilisin, kexin, sedolisin n=1 Tax=Rubrobacter xylanophilus (strain DSM 9941 / JCM 11954 / NBRC 16129 / PRD-1) TaxID=266117 RepID=Q1ATZ6_RUBXD|nr:S8 family peptidase [Rubrobacter xylanophilus]ABG05132.1 peptidase S8 and S53, subtilisin, kexin, sedolisin [Rubrobacter xylanophilus DSM 9941]
MRGRPAVRRSALQACAGLAACLLALLLLPAAGRGEPEGEVDALPGGARYVAGELLVVYRSAPGLERALEATGGRVKEELPASDARLVVFPAVREKPSEALRERLLREKKRALEQSPAVEAVSFNYLREPLANPNDRYFGRQWGLRKIRAPLAWSRARGGGARVAVLDSGVAAGHPDLRGKIAGRYNTDTRTSSAGDQYGHGTHVAGIAAASTNNRIGVAGTCPGCRLLAVKLDGDGLITTTDLVRGINWAIGRRADVINLSLGGGGFSRPEADAIAKAWNRGAVVVAAAGNERSSRRTYPAAYPQVIAVSATTRSDARARYSNYGGWVDVAAPGGTSGTGGIYSTLPGGRYGYLSGTSMAAPFVSGVAGLLAGQDLANSQIRRRIQSTAADLGPRGRDPYYGHGRLDAAAAVGAA